MKMKFFDRKGDEGYTSLRFGERISKYDPRPDTYGTLDEVNSALGLARAFAKNQKTRDLLFYLQRKLFIIGEETSTEVGKIHLLKKRVNHKTVEALEKEIEALEDEIAVARTFIIPGDTASSAAMDLARTFIRRAERKVHRLKDEGLLINHDIPHFLNRLADLLFLLARFEEREETGS